MSEQKRNKLSYSALRTYNECGKKYYYNYVERLREKIKGSPLIFGSAFDKAIESVLKDPSVNEYEIFDKEWTTQDINGKVVTLPGSLLVRYSNTDFDSDLLDISDIKFLVAKANELFKGVPGIPSDLESLHNMCMDAKRAKNISEEAQTFLNYCAWLSLRRKGHLMLKANREQVLPRFKRILEVQKKIELNNGQGDTLVGYADLIVVWEDNKPTVMDYKTSSVPYPKDSVQTSDQLTIYGHALELTRGGYIVFSKKVNKNRKKLCSTCGFDGSGRSHSSCFNEINGKRCGAEWIESIAPSIDVTFIVDDIPVQKEDEVLAMIEANNTKIHNQEFEKNLDACYNPFPCPYAGLCHKGKMDDLEKV